MSRIHRVWICVDGRGDLIGRLRTVAQRFDDAELGRGINTLRNPGRRNQVEDRGTRRLQPALDPAQLASQRSDCTGIGSAGASRLLLGSERATDVVGGHQMALPDDSTHVLPLRLRDLSGRTPSRSHHHAIRSGMTLPCVQITGVPSDAAISRMRRRAGLAIVCVGLLGQQRLLVNRDAEFFGQRFEGLLASGAIGRIERVAPNANSCPTNDSAWARPRLSSGRYRSSPL